MISKKKFYLVLILVVTIMALSACNDNDRDLIDFSFYNPPAYPIDRDDFIAAKEAEGFEIMDVSHQVDFANYVILAIPPSDDYQIEFYEFDTDEDAGLSFEATRQLLEEVSESSDNTNSVDFANYNRFTIISGDLFAHLHRIGNTMIFVDWTDLENRDEISDLLGDFED